MTQSKDSPNISGLEELKNLVHHIVPEGEFSRQAEAAKQAVNETVHQKPLAALGIAFGAGLLLGLLLKK
ncbi:MAG: hypothetical protein LAT75_11550 [Candidatus Cyclonatronum sp.]|uniref:glycine zipper domain-containing protein n=1 Tax=Cyclonatronum sp. TaxID=3024185 RepID=UPI0025C0B173|nr:hypothetical protein [Cyclonatronum sp.]MCC5933392.1 hypothetical protein [Balneolales bacterium]MCH8487492.1 hypothetical protein [Cyclonatronum sp.]